MGDRPARVLMVAGDLAENGGLRVTHDLARRWTAAHLPVQLLVLETVGPGQSVLTPDPAICLTFASPRVRRFRHALPRVIAELVRAARRCDVVVSGSEVGYGVLLGLPVARLTRRPFVVLVQSSLDHAVAQWRPARLRRLLLRAHRHVDLAVCVSPGLVEDVVRNGLAPERVRVVDVGIDVDDVIRRGRIAAPVAPGGQAVVADASGQAHPVVLAAGRLVPGKGFDVLVRAHARVRAQGLDHVLRIVGGGPELGPLGQLAADLGVADSVELTGFVVDPQPLIAAADLFVLSSYYEGTGGLVLFEALAHRVPIVATDCHTGPRRVLQDGVLGALVPVGDVAAMAAAIADHLRDPAPLRARVQAGPDRAREFDAGRAATVLRRLIEDVAAGRSVRGMPTATVPAETVAAETVEAETVEAETVEAETVEAETVAAETVAAETVPAPGVPVPAALDVSEAALVLPVPLAVPTQGTSRVDLDPADQPAPASR